MFRLSCSHLQADLLVSRFLLGFLSVIGRLSASQDDGGHSILGATDSFITSSGDRPIVTYTIFTQPISAAVLNLTRTPVMSDSSLAPNIFLFQLRGTIHCVPRTTRICQHIGLRNEESFPVFIMILLS